MCAYVYVNLQGLREQMVKENVEVLIAVKVAEGQGSRHASV